MRKVFDRLHHHGKTVYKHAQKHHKKYIWGAAGFFGLFKLFSFLLVSIFGYTLTQANTPSISFLEIPATTIDVQDNKSIVQFDLRAIDPSYYTSIKNISLHLDIVTENTSITLKTLRNNKINALGEKFLSSRILQLQKNEDTQRILNPMSISGIIQELLSGNVFVYLLPEEPVYLSAYDVSLEIEIQAADNQTISGIEDMPIQELETYKEAENISLQNTEYTTSMSIISSFFATGKDADPYLHRDASSDCQFMNTSLIPLQAGIDTIPRYLSPDTIYVLEPGIYISNYMTEITGSCTALIGINSGVHLFTSKTQGAHIKISGGRDAILHNLNLYGEDDGVGGSHTPNNYGIFVDAQDTTVYGIWAHNYLGFGVYMEDFDTLIADVYSYTHESVFLYPYADTYIDESKKFRDYNYGKSDQLDLDHKGTKSLLQFDLSSLPSSATVLSGQMRLTRVGGNANDFFAKKILNNNRKEGLGNGTLAVFGEVNYNFLGYQDRLWYGDEGMQVGMDYAYENVLEQSVFKKKNTPQWFDFTQEGISVLQDWVRYPQRNLGVVLTTDDKTLVVGSREYDNELYRPALRVDYMYEDTNAQNAPVLLPRTTDVDIVKEIMIANGYVDTGDNLVGTKPISLSLSEGNLPVATIMESVDDQIRIALPEDTKIKKENGSNYTGIFVGPKNISLSTVSEKQINQKAFKTFKIGSDKEKLFIKDDAGNVRKIFVTVPVVGYASGEQISVYYSHDNKILHFLRTVKVENSQGKSYIHFETDHFTTFELGSTMCSFTINGDASTTSTREVTLITADCKEGDPKNMIIGNDLAAVEAAIAAGKRVSFSRESVWTLLGDKDPGDATVYAAFTDGKDTVITSDTIYLSTLTSSCGDGMEGKSEQCDDGNTNNGDGCSSTCQWETRSSACATKPSYTNWNTVSTITQTCGASNGSTCSSWTPTLTPSYNISASTTTCRYICAAGYSWNGSNCTLAVSCGNGSVGLGEQCDDGNTNNGDGCSSTCQWETRSSACSAKPSYTNWNTVSTITQTCGASNGSTCSSWTPTLTPSYNISASTTTCRYICAAGYLWSGSICTRPIVVATGNIRLASTTIVPGSSVSIQTGYIINTTGKKHDLILSGVTAISVSGATWDGWIAPPTKTTDPTPGQGGLPSNQRVTATYVLGSTNTSNTTTLNAVGANFYVKIELTGAVSGEIINVYRSSNGITRAPNSPDTTCIVDANFLCTFSTNHLTTFTFAGVSSTFFINVGDPVYTNTATVSLRNSVSGATRMRFSNTGSSGPWTPSTYATYATTYAWTLQPLVTNSGSQSRTVWAGFATGAGVYTITSDTIIGDTLAPSIIASGYVRSGIMATNGTYDYYRGVVNVRGTFTETTSGVSCRYSTNGTTWSAGTLANPFSSTYTCTSPAINPQANINIKIAATDAAGNTTTGTNGTTRYYDIDAPKAGIDPNGVLCTGTNVGVTVACTEGAGVGCDPTTSTHYKIVNTGVTCDTSSLTTGSASQYFSINGIAGTYTQKKVCYRAFDRLGNASTITGSANYNIDKIGPNAPTLSNPTNGSTIPSATSPVTFSWIVPTDIGCSTPYSSQLYVYTGSTCDAQYEYTSMSNASGTTSQYVYGMPDGSYSWKVRYEDALLNRGTRSVCRTFTIGSADTTPPAVGTAYLSYGNFNGTYFNGAIRIAASATDANGISSCQYYNGSSWSAGTWASNVCTSPSWSPGANFYGNIRAYDPSNNLGTGTQRYFTYDATAPGTPSTVSPTSGATVGSTTVNLIWSAVTDAGVGMSGYYYQLSTGTAFTTIIRSGTGSITGATVSSLSTGIVYYRRVIASDKLGNISSRSHVPNFIISLGDTIPPVVELLFPGDGDTYTLSNNVPFVWSGSDNVGITYYTLFVDSGGWISYGPIYTTGYTLNLPDGDYRRYVEGYDAAGNTGVSDGRRLTVAGNIPPTVGIGYISVGMTGDNGQGDNYYKGTITISGAVSDDLGLNTGTCMYTINGSARSAANYSGTSTTGYCYTGGLTPGVNINIQFKIQDAAANLTTGATGSYIYDATAPGTGTFTINGGAEYTNTGIVNITDIDCPVDAGIGLSGIYIGNSINPTNQIGCTSSITSRVLSGGDGLRYVYMRGVDKLWNTGANFSDTITVDTANPTVGQAYIYSGTTGYNAPNNYYKGIVDIRATTSDTNGISGATCEYTTGSSWAAASRSAPYCYKTGLNYISTLNINFRVRDVANNTGVGTTGTYLYDGTAPMIIFTGSTPANNTTGTINTFTPQLQITETGIGLGQFLYTRNGQTYSVYDSGLVAMYNFDALSALGEVGSVVKDMSQYGNNGTINGTITTIPGKWNGAYTFNGTTAYISAQTNLIGTSATFVARAKTNVVNPQMLWNHPSNASTTYYDLWFMGNSIYLNIGDGNGNPFSGGGMNVSQPSTGQRHHYITVIDAVANKSSLYIDGIYVGQALYRNPTSTTGGRVFSIAGPASYRWNGSIDEVRVYNRALSTGEIDLLYRSNLNKFSTTQWLFTDERMCISNGTYNYTGSAADLFQNTYATGRRYGINITGVYIGFPRGIDLGSVTSSGNAQTLSGQFSGYFYVQDDAGTTGWYSTIMLPLALTGRNNPNLYIGNSNIYFNGTGGVSLLNGTLANPFVYISTGVYMSGATPNYVNFLGSRHYIKRDISPSPYLCGTGRYGNLPWMKVTIPARQGVDTYSGLITIDINAP